MKKKLFLIDGHSYLYQAFYAIRGLSGPRGEPINAVYGFINMVLSVLKKEKPDYVAVVFDHPEPSFRHKMFTDYKATRKPMPSELSSQIPVVEEIVTAYGFPVYSVAGFEADDVIATIVETVHDDVEVFIISRDKDFKQILREGVYIYDTRKAERTGVDDFVAEFGFEPKRFADYLALRGDKSDNIPGVNGIGEKSAKELIKEFGSLEGVYSNLDRLPAKTANRLRDGRDAAFIGYELAKVKTDVPFRFRLEDSAVRSPDKEKLLAIFQRFNFKKFMEELKADETVEAAEESVNYILVNDEKSLERMLERLESAEAVAVDTETTSENEQTCSLVGLSFSPAAGEGFYVPVAAPRSEKHLRKEMVLTALRGLLEDENKPKFGQNMKFDYTVLKREGITLKPLVFDSMVAAYLIDPTGRGYGLDALALRYLGRKNIPIEALIGKGKKQLRMDMVPLKDITRYACEDADVVMRLEPILRKRLKEMDVERLFEEVEMPLVEVLAEMQLVGICVDAEYLHLLSEEMLEEIKRLKSEIYELAGHEFNIESPRQLAGVLYEELGLPRIRKTRTGQAATDAEVLSQLAAHHRLPTLVMKYRTLTKFKSTYVEGLISMILDDGRVHTSFNQTATATGRLSSSEPNLQNIPIRDEWGKRIRKAFVPQNRETHSFLSADYSQIELRFLAHFSGDESLCKAFEAGEDIHTFVASKVRRVPLESVTPEMRRQAKAVNFGIIYGLSAHGLATQLGIPHQEAQEYIETYFANHPDVRRFIDETIKDARRRGFVTTIMGRKRFIAGLNSSDRTERSAAERLAVNTVMQGSSADLIKLAMIKIHKTLKKEGSPTKMVLQIHDELLFEIPDDRVEKEKELISDIMCSVISLNVPLVVDTSVGKDWAECK